MQIRKLQIFNFLLVQNHLKQRTTVLPRATTNVDGTNAGHDILCWAKN